MKLLRSLKRQIIALGITLLALGIAVVLSAGPAKTIPIPTSYGLVVKQSPYSVEETERRFLGILNSKGLNTFATIDHARNAEGVELALRPTRVVIFGNPNLGTPLMQCNQSLAIDLPQKLLIWQDETDQVNIAYNDPRYLGGRHQIGDCNIRVIGQIAGALDKLTNGVIAP